MKKNKKWKGKDIHIINGEEVVYLTDEELFNIGMNRIFLWLFMACVVVLGGFILVNVF